MIRIAGGEKLAGTVQISGAKNAALPAIIASLLTTKPVVLHNVPHLADVETAVTLVQALGKEVRWRGRTMEIRGGEELHPEAPAELVQRMRASFLALGPLLARAKRAKVPLPGGCALGPRPVDFHLYGLARLGARITFANGAVLAEAKFLRGTSVYLDFPSVGATEQLLLAGTLAEGETVIINPAREPEVADLAELLRKMGAEVRWDTDRVTIRGRRELEGAEHTLIPDRIETGTYLLAGAITGGKVRAENVEPQHLAALLDRLSLAGCEIEVGKAWVELIGPRRPKPVDFRTWPYPGFPTDLQPPMVAFLALAEGRSTITETVYAARFGHVEPLLQMGAKIQVSGSVQVVDGVEGLRPAAVEATDIRAGAALVLAALAANGVSHVRGEQHIRRGYENMVEKLRALGARVWEEED
ncbi:UDP-N-acetylglucosamine 1-carboxyvinyltransferase [Candidatus Bipolaricaulota bacterium]|nr:UDP-N-acetylglucosamine 1-carboxyvinyltransferase [Candidatus Bipolaricaulota bacterium]